MANNTLTYETAVQLWDYDPETGCFSSKPRRWVVVGRNVGTIETKGYVKLRAKGITVRAHRVAWLMTYGVWPKGEVDHINGNRADNRLINLRDVSRGVNSENRRTAMPFNVSGLLGVCSPFGAEKKFKAAITNDGRTRVIGRYETAQEAHEAYVLAKRKLHEGCTL